MSRTVTVGSTDQSIRFWAYDSSGSVVTGEAYNSAGMAISIVVRSAGRIVSTTALTLVARSGVGVHTDSALTEVGNGEYVVDLPDSYSATDNRSISLTVSSTAITGSVLVETITVGYCVNVTQIEGSTLGTHGIGQFPADVRDWGGLGAVIAIDADNSAPSVAVSHIHDDVISAASVSAAAVTKIQNGLASQTSVNDVPTNAELATALATADDAVLAAIAALNNLSAAQVNAEMLDVLNVDTFGELAAPPAATSSLRDKLTWIFMCHRNLRTETATQRKLFADNGSTLVGTEAVSDNGTTFTKEKVV